MKTLKTIGSAIVVFIFGLEVGGFGMWYLTNKSLTELNRETRSRTRRRTYYNHGDWND